MRVTIMALLLSVTVPLIVLAQTADELKHDEKTPGDVLTYGMGYRQQRFSRSPTSIVTTSNDSCRPGHTPWPTTADKKRSRWSRTGSSISPTTKRPSPSTR